MQEVTYRYTCRACGGNLSTLKDFGPLPMMGVFREVHEHVPLYPLSLTACESCLLLQLRHTVDPKETFKEGFGYRSATNESMVAHLKELAEELYGEKGKGAVIDIACNDNTFLKFIPKDAVRIGVDPVGQDAEGITTIKEFLSQEVCDHLPRAGLVTAFAVVYDLDDPVEFFRQVASILTDDGLFALEVGDGMSLLEGTFDVICHEHLSFFGIRHLRAMGLEAGLTLESARLTKTNGGSLLVKFRKKPRYTLYGKEEALEALEWTGQNIVELPRRIEEWAEETHELGRSLGNMVGLAASTKGNFTLQVARLTDYVTAVVDRGEHKVGKVIPGTRIPIIGEGAFMDLRPQKMLALAWHFLDSMTKRYQLDRPGNRILIPLPRPHILTT